MNQKAMPLNCGIEKNVESALDIKKKFHSGVNEVN